MDALTSLLAVALVSILAVISPGPDFAIVLKNSLVHSRKAGMLSAVGICLALIIHLSYTLIGIGLLIAENPYLYSIIKYVGVAYLFYIGCKGVISSYNKASSLDLEYTKSANQISSTAALMQGFLTNLLNPKAAIFFISLFSQFIDSNTSVLLRLEYAFINWSVALFWFLFLAYIVTCKHILGKINQYRLYIDRVMGYALMLLGVRLLLV